MTFSQLKHFKPCEFFGQADLVSPITLIRLDQARALLNQPIHISPAQGAIARFGGSKHSQHYVGPDPDKIERKSTAIDVFIEGIPYLNYTTLLHSKLFTAVGIYFDTAGVNGKPWVMLHLDNRERSVNLPTLTWIATKTQGRMVYDYPQADPNKWQLLNNPDFFREISLR